MPEPKPRQLDGIVPRSSVVRLADPLITAISATGVGRRRETDIAGELPWVAKAAVKYLASEDRRSLGPDTLDRAQPHRDRIGDASSSGCVQPAVALPSPASRPRDVSRT